MVCNSNNYVVLGQVDAINYTMSSLQALTQANSVRLVRSTVSSDPKKINDLDEDSRTALHWACSTSNYEIVEILTGYDECGVDIKDGAGWTALMIAASVGNDDILKRLIEKGANVNETSSSGQSALYVLAFEIQS
ncbi:26S proteasome non-ATPase regulatory subunit 10 [Neolecta irregularis DAH-3]|uniref:26S proteasome non-ATPase regulatory subunit 10 n=1 Tax=Neolecta irregularis (strain DAH-3) TaxID=1198029 RepID=A0A1U7LIN8_NEOID|nr:26S proteasome non-ATPase regulatory subunit 10 [Neolecta irregularis DAH-3]|eukprot:OLL22391.1 26S proteasome non-ATPase regulatory subunit 10 [Neolecta irregularis DAH-3]